ncbi:MAG TPA: hypothetical protein PK154_09335 [Methanoregulaceae archaeon]|nr:hypothetical protein [Methanoregulaceae archaeon]HOB59882.1 hypothetical protein [Methanoregulaceae archaeon]HPW11300.1 hypothetical protein [Methanoregulaceae archaeon]
MEGCRVGTGDPAGDEAPVMQGSAPGTGRCGIPTGGSPSPVVTGYGNGWTGIAWMVK